MKCANCGKEFEGNFCPECGTKAEEIKVEKATAEETATEEVKAEEATAEETATEEAKTEEATAEETATEEAKTEEATAEETRTEEAKTEEATAEETKTEELKAEAPKTEAPKKNKTVKIIVIIAAIVAAVFVLFAILVLAIVLILNKPKTIKINDYVNVEFNGYDTIGRANLVYDKNALLQDASKVKLRTNNYKKYLIDEMGFSKENANEAVAKIKKSNSVPALFIDAIDDGSLSADKQLTNGDTVNIVTNIDIEKVESLFKVKIKENPEKNAVAVIGLQSVPTFDPFELIDVTFGGYAPNGYVSIEKKTYDGETGYLSFSADKYDGLSNGDTVTITCSYLTTEDGFVDEFNKIPSQLEKEYKVENLMSYVLQSSAIPEDTMALMKSQADSIVISKYASWYDYGDNESRQSLKTVQSAECIGNYFLTLKDGYSGYDNVCYLVYEIITAENMIPYKGSEITETAKSYVAVGFSNITIDGTGAGNVDISWYEFKYDTYDDSKTYEYDSWGYTFQPTIYGYQTIDLLYNDVVTKNAANYNYENNVVVSQ